MSASAEDRAAALLATRIVATALIMGPAIFLAVVFYLRSIGGVVPHYDDSELYTPEQAAEGRATDKQRNEILHWILLALGMGAVTAHVVIPPMYRKKVGATLDSFRAITIVRLAMTEGVALFGCVCFLLSGHPFGAGVTIAMLGFALALQFPTRERLDAWLDQPA